LPTTKVIKTETVTLEINDLLTTVSLEVSTEVGTVKLFQGPEGIALTIGEASIKVTLQGMDLAMPASTVSVAADSITLKTQVRPLKFRPPRSISRMR